MRTVADTEARAVRQGWRWAWTPVASVVLAVALLMALGAIGARARAPEGDVEDEPAFGPLVAVERSDELQDAWDGIGAHGAVLLDLTTVLGYTQIDWGPGLGVSYAYPVDLFDIGETYRDMTTRDDHIWVAARLGSFRRVYYLVPEPDFSDLVQWGRDAGLPGIADDGSLIRANSEGYVRIIAPTLPEPIEGPLVLNVDASYFENGTPEELLEALRASGHVFSATTLNSAFDDEFVTPGARERLRDFEALVREGGE